MLKVNLNTIDPEEFLDLVDTEDNVIAKAGRKEIFRSGINNYRVVNIFIFNNTGEVLVPKRTANRSIFPNCYDFSCGEHVTSGETYEQAAVRGLKEELNIETSNSDLILLGKLTPAQVSSFMCVYKLDNINKIPVYNKKEIASASFMPIEELKRLSNKNPELFKSDIPKVLALLF